LDPGARRPSAILTAFVAAASAFLVAAVAAAVASEITGLAWLHWLALHLVFLGGVSQLVLGAGQFFTCAVLASTPPPRWLVNAQLLAWNAGTVLVAAGVPTGTNVLTDVGGGLIAVGLLLFAGSLRGMQRRSLQHARWAVRWYQACAACLGIGVLVGIAMARGTPWSHGSLLGAHLALNLAGWMGTAIVGTLHTFFPSLTQTQLRFARLQGATFGLWVGGVGSLATGAALGSNAVVALGWIGLALAAAALSANLLASLAAAAPPLSLPARLVALGQLFLPVGVIVALVSTLAEGAYAPFLGPIRGALAVLLLAGWIGLTVAGSLMHLLAVLARVRRFAFAMPPPRPRRDLILTVAAFAGIAGTALSKVDGLDVLGAPARILVIAVSLVIAVRILNLGVRAFRAAADTPLTRARPA
jgi:nitrite reductase (NO-forming)